MNLKTTEIWSGRSRKPFTPRRCCTRPRRMPGCASKTGSRPKCRLLSAISIFGSLSACSRPRVSLPELQGNVYIPRLQNSSNTMRFLQNDGIWEPGIYNANLKEGYGGKECFEACCCFPCISYGNYMNQKWNSCGPCILGTIPVTAGFAPIVMCLARLQSNYNADPFHRVLDCFIYNFACSCCMTCQAARINDEMA